MKHDIINARGCSRQIEKERKCNPYSCNQLNVFNTLKGIPLCSNSPNIVEVRFKNTRKAFFKNENNLRLQEGDMVAVEASPGHDIGIISLTGELVIEQMRRKNIDINSEFKKVYRIVREVDIDKWREAIERENRVMLRTRAIAKELNLDMKIGDVEFQGDGTKAIFYYIADDRVDFRKLIKVLAEEFKIRIEMKQIGARQEAGRIGGIGSCGRELCCSSWMSKFITVSTDTARDQEITVNPQKLAGQCSKLKCCLNFEVEGYRKAKREFPSKVNLETKEGTAYYMKTDVYKGTMMYSFAPGEPKNVTEIPVERVVEIIEMNKNNELPEKLKIKAGEIDAVLGFKNIVGEESITRFSDKKKKNRKSRRKNRQKRFNNKNSSDQNEKK